MAEVTISDLRNLDSGGSSLLFAVDGDDETFNISLSTVFEYVKGRLGSLDTGAVEMYMGEVTPDTHTELDGKSFDPLVFPKMGALFPNGVLPDTRGMMLKHAPDGRSILSFEAEAIKSHSHTASSSSVFSGSPLSPHKHLSYHPRGDTAKSDGDKSSAWEGVNDIYTTETNSVSAGTPAGSVSTSTTVNSSGSAKNLVDNIAVKFIIKKA
jgi:hypothetical protein